MAVNATTRLAGTPAEQIGSDTLRRVITVRPGMCGPGSLFLGQIGDWTWETVSVLCDTNVFSARDQAGAPTYLSFYYVHIRASGRAHIFSFTFGDELEVVSRAYDFGSESVLVLHRIRRADAQAVPMFDAAEFYERPRADSLYVATFNRWVSRGTMRSNAALVTSAPARLRHSHLPALPRQYSPRLSYGRARRDQTFHDPSEPGWGPAVPGGVYDHAVDPNRDVNGIGLLYFAAYFSIVDSALLEHWQSRGRDTRAFLDRVVLDQKLCYLGNADIDATLRTGLVVRESTTGQPQELYDAVITEVGTARVLAVSTLRIRSEAIHAHPE